MSHNKPIQKHINFYSYIYIYINYPYLPKNLKKKISIILKSHIGCHAKRVVNLLVYGLIIAYISNQGKTVCLLREELFGGEGQ